MINVLMALKQFIVLLRKENLHKVFLFALAILVGGAMLLTVFEPGLTLSDALWWSVVTMTTVGYGDISPASGGGRVVAMVVMLSGIGLIGVLTATIAGLFIENKLLEKKGMKETDVSDHFLICGWNSRGETIISEMMADPKCSTQPIVIIAELQDNPDPRDNVHFIRGQITPETLDKAHAANASAAIILSDDHLDTYSRDAKTILNTMMLKNHVPDLYACVELMDPKNMAHCTMAKANEIIVVGELSTNLLVQAALDHGVTRLISELVSNRYGNDLYKIPVPPYLDGKTFFEAMVSLKKKENILCIGVEDASGEHLLSNPENDYCLNSDDILIVIAQDRPASA